MGRHLILTVHGIGEQKPGETVDQVVGAATTWVDGNRRPPVEIDRQMIELAESNFDGSSRNAKLFKVNLRKVSKPNDNRDQALFAEVFWADRSPAPKGTFRTVLDLVWVVLALGYLAMDNVEQTHRRSGIDPSQPDGRNTRTAQIVHLFTWVFFGAVATLNTYLLIGAAAVMVDLLPGGIADGTAVLFSLLLLLYVVGAAFGAKRWNTARTYLQRVFWRGMTVMGFALAAALVVGPLGIGLWGCMGAPPGVEGTCGSALGQFVALQVFVLAIFWALLIFMTALMYVMSLAKLDVGKKLTEHRRIYPSVCAGMLVFWMFFISGLWLGFKQLVATVPGLSASQLQTLFESHLEGSIETLSAAFAAIVILAIVGTGLFGGRRLGKDNLHTKNSLLSRAILNRLTQWVFLAAAVTLTLMVAREIAIAYGFDPVCASNPPSGNSEPDCNLIGKALNALANAQGMIGLVVLGAVTLLYRMSNFVAAGLGVARDIVTYAIRDKCALRQSLESRRDNYPDRHAIDERFYRTLYYALDIFPADHITVISHSQGTVIATQMLADERVQRRIDNRPVTLITMGAPVTHIYQRYFPEMFTVNPNRLHAAWFNIFRQDDFVGTRIEGGLIDETRNIPVQPGGHTGYFTDYQVWKVLTGDDIGFDLFHPKRHG
ncbi:hypothetical protein HW561_15285 [Rhodobacteraceae bacterium B1Z28]|uniref:Alpha/beta hydrolase n=1 Tax=Ruegeria haliotis TaxID=2747601 RepID=A0ABX2PUX1_9RHOB|nr:hypothetical protein [Ruegeria haliotis]NVO57156.1 hypothetical protein [Ruegeria haliotis]